MANTIIQKSLLTVLLALCVMTAAGQDSMSGQPAEVGQDSMSGQPAAAGQDSVRVQRQRLMFWNVENAFWPEDDATTEDDEFTPAGARHWTMSRLRSKLSQLTRVILAAGEGLAPMVVGLAEVEGDSVMDYWTKHTPLRDLHYDYVVTHGPDRRGIQTALLYIPTDFRLISAEAHRVMLPEGVRPTRDVLHAAGRLVSGDTLDVVVCHLPSRLGGARKSQPTRNAAHRCVSAIADSLQHVRQHPLVVIMGDMNDTPSQRQTWWPDTYHNLMLPLQHDLLLHPSRFGSHKYGGQWSYLDQIIVCNETRQLLHDAQSCCLPFMLTDDVTHQGHRPARSYYGYQYEGGYSDHLPVLVCLDVYF